VTGGRRIGVDLDVISDILRVGASFVLRWGLVITGNV
jgi:hypothetical protein